MKTIISVLCTINVKAHFDVEEHFETLPTFLLTASVI